MGNAPALWKRIRRFALVGGTATVLHTLVAFVTIRFLAAPPVLGNVTAFLIATVFSYYAQTLWSFEHSSSPKIMGKFGVVVAVGLLCTVAVAGGVDRMGYPYWAGIIAVVAVVPAVTFLLHNFWTYAEPRRPTIG